MSSLGTLTTTDGPPTLAEQLETAIDAERDSDVVDGEEAVLATTDSIAPIEAVPLEEAWLEELEGCNEVVLQSPPTLLISRAVVII